MCRPVVWMLILGPLVYIQAGCGSWFEPGTEATDGDSVSSVAVKPGDANTPPTKPVPPLKLAAPPALPEQVDGQDLKAMDERDLLGRANQAMDSGNYPRAANYQYWYMQASKTGQYNLACFLARSGRSDPAFYYLQVAALEEGVDTAHALRDEDLTSLRSDARWPKVRKFLADCNRYFESAQLDRTILVLPEGYDKSTPIPAILWLHGLGARPDELVNACQGYADGLNVAFIGVSGTKPRGPRSYVWAEDPAKDSKRLRAALTEVSNRVTIKKGQIVTLGFSQGAQVGLEVAVRYPEEYAGSIVLSPGADSHLNGVAASPLLARRGFVVSCGADEFPGNVQLTAEDANWLRRAKAQVIHKAYPGVSAHSLPPDFGKRLPEWIQFILKTRGD